jgi:hypothetical protein
LSGSREFTKPQARCIRCRINKKLKMLDVELSKLENKFGLRNPRAPISVNEGRREPQVVGPKDIEYLNIRYAHRARYLLYGPTLLTCNIYIRDRKCLQFIFIYSLSYTVCYYDSPLYYSLSPTTIIIIITKMTRSLLQRYSKISLSLFD